MLGYVFINNFILFFKENSCFSLKIVQTQILRKKNFYWAWCQLLNIYFRDVLHYQLRWNLAQCLKVSQTKSERLEMPAWLHTWIYVTHLSSMCNQIKQQTSVYKSPSTVANPTHSACGTLSTLKILLKLRTFLLALTQ